MPRAEGCRTEYLVSFVHSAHVGWMLLCAGHCREGTGHSPVLVREAPSRPLCQGPSFQSDLVSRTPFSEGVWSASPLFALAVIAQKSPGLVIGMHRRCAFLSTVYCAEFCVSSGSGSKGFPVGQLRGFLAFLSFFLLERPSVPEIREGILDGGVLVFERVRSVCHWYHRTRSSSGCPSTACMAGA